MSDPHEETHGRSEGSAFPTGGGGALLPPPGGALWRWSAHSLAAAIRHGAVSPHEAVISRLERVQAVNPALNAIVDLLADDALAAARAADAARQRGEALGPLHGVPVTVKVNVDLRGRATTNGVVAFTDNLATEDSPVVTNLRRACPRLTPIDPR